MRDTRRTRVVLGALLAVALLLIGFSYADSSNPVLRGARNAAGTVFGGAEQAGSSAGHFFDRSGQNSAQVTSLQRQVLRLQAELSGARVSKADAAQLRKLLLAAGAERNKVVAARVIATGQGGVQAVTLDAGSGDGVLPGQTVLSGEGLVGRVTAVTAGTATVQLASAPDAVIGVAVSPRGQLGYIRGPGKVRGTGIMRLQMLSSAAQLKPGEAVVTGPSQGSQPYAPGIPVGRVTRLVSINGGLAEAADVRPYVNYSALSVVGIVIQQARHNPRFAGVPPLPHPLPAVTVTVTAKPRRGGATPAPAPSAGG